MSLLQKTDSLPVHSWILRDFAQFAVKSILALVYFEPIFQDQFGFLDASSQFRILVEIDGCRGGVGEVL